LVSSNAAVEVFYWFVGLTTTALIMTYTGMLAVFIGWHRARKAQPDVVPDESLPYRAPLAPWSAYFAVFLGCVTMIFIGFDTFAPFSVQGFITSYFALGFGPFMFVLWKVVKRTKYIHPRNVDLVSGKAEVDEECRLWEDGGVEENERRRLQQMSLLRRTWERIW
jgi:amino acid transporter